MKQTIIQNYSTSLVSGMIEKSKSIKKLEHNVVKGQLRELFISDVIKPFLPFQFDIGTGIIINQKGEQSKQTDLIIYDKRILPPFIKEQNLGLYPIECVLATIEVKSKLTSKELLETDEKVTFLNESIANRNKSMYFNEKSTLYSLTKSICNSDDNKVKFYIHNFKPLNGIFAFYGYGPNDLSDSELGKKYLNHKIKNIFGICLLNKFCWMNLRNWCLNKNISSHDEVKRFIAVFIDNILTKAYFRNRLLSLHHFDFNSIYIRDQESIVKFFEKYS